MIATYIRPKHFGLENQQKPLLINAFYASKLQDYSEEGLLFQNTPKTWKSPMLTQITYF